jgi:hypothetical protein
MSPRKRKRRITREQAQQHREAVRRGQRMATEAPDRWEYAQSLRDAGHSLDDIAGALGVTRQRVQQKTRCPVRVAKTHLDPILVVRALRDPSSDSIATLGANAGWDGGTVLGCLNELGMAGAAKRLMRWRRAAPTRRRHAALIRAEYDLRGRTPTLCELSQAMSPDATPALAAATFRSVFGSIQRAMEYAGVPHRSVHARGAAKFANPSRGPSIVCRKGHTRRQQPSGFWTCDTCRATRRRAA